MKIKICFFRWGKRETPPFFGFCNTWIYVCKLTANSFNEEAIKNILENIADKYEAENMKINCYSNGSKFSRYYKTEEIE